MNQSNRFNELDSLRGIASFQVFLGHYLVAIPSLGWLVYDKVNISHDGLFFLAHSPVHFFWSASPAVIIFFVLSGFVLSLPYYSDNIANPKYKTFFIKRIVRLYIPCILAITLAYVLYKLFYNAKYLFYYDTWLIDMWSKLGKFKLFDFIFLTDCVNYVPSSWTLPIEIKLSLILPAFIIGQKNLKLIPSILLFFIIPIITTILGKLFLYKVFPDFRIMFYFTFFTLGSTLCKYRKPLIYYFNYLTDVTYYFLLFFLFLLFSIDYNTWILPKNYLASYKLIEHYIISIPASGFVIYSLTDRLHSFMNNKLLVFIGKISFSLYLTHQVILTLIVLLFNQYFKPDMWLLIFCFPFAILFAFMFYYIVEFPTLNINKMVANKMK